MYKILSGKYDTAVIPRVNREGKGYFAERGMRNAESCERVICGK